MGGGTFDLNIPQSGSRQRDNTARYGKMPFLRQVAAKVCVVLKLRSSPARQGSEHVPGTHYMPSHWTLSEVVGAGYAWMLDES